MQRISISADAEETDKVRIAVEGKSVYFKFRSVAVLKDANISVKQGVIYGLLGPSGCGKTTLLRCIVGRYKPCSGTIKIYGKVPGKRGFSIPGPGVGYMPQELALYPEITTEETLTYFGRIYQMSERDIKQRISFLTEFLDIPDKKKLINQLSGGQQRRVSFAVALIHKPPLVILDEPTVGVDPLLRKSIWNYLQKLAAVDSLTIIITTHYVEEARQAHAVGLMRDGHLLAEANPEHLINQHNALTLEDVFLKLCVKDMHATEAKEDSNIFGQTEETDDLNCESYDDVWIKQKVQRQPYLPPATNGSKLENGAGYRASLLSEPVDPECILNPELSCRSVIQRSSVRMRALIAKSFVRLKRNIPLVFFQLFVPTFQVIVFCLCVGGEPFDLPLAVVNMEEDPLGKSDYFLTHINSKTIHQIPFSNLTPAIESVKNGENWGVLHIGPAFTDNLLSRYLQGIQVDNETIEASTVMLYLDMTNQQILMTIHTKVMQGFQEFAEHILEDFNQNPLLAQLPLKLGTPIYGHEKPDFTEFMAPGMILGITYIMAVGLSSMSIIIEKKEGLLDRSWIAGVRAWEVMFSILFTLFIVMLFQVALVLLCTFLAFNISCLGSLVWVVIAVILVGLEGMSYGLFISSIVNDENIAMMIAMGSFYPNLLLSGIIWPVEAMPYVLRHLSYCLPLTLIANTMRCVLSRGWSIVDHGIWNGYLVAIAWIIPVIFIASVFFRYKK